MIAILRNALTSFGALLYFPAVCFQADSGQKSQELVQKLRSGEVDVRDQAIRKLKELGKAAVPELEKATKDSDAEVAAQAKRLLRVFGVMEDLTPELLKALPGVEERLADGEESAWTNAFLEAVEEVQGKLRHPTLTIADLERISARAMRGATTSDKKQEVCDAAGKWGSQAAIPGIVKLLEDTDAAVSGKALSALETMGAREAIPDLLKLLKGGPNQYFAITALGKLRAKEAIPEILPFLKKDIAGSDHACWALADLGAKEAIPEIVKVLHHRNPQARWMAATALACLGAKDAARDIVTLLDDEAAGATAAWALGSLDAKETIPELKRSLKNNDPFTRHAAAEALAQLGAKEEALPELLKLLEDANASVRYFAARTLGRLGSKDGIPALLGLLKDPDVSIPVAQCLCGLGSREGVPLLLEHSPEGQWGTLNSLNALRQPETWKRLKNLPGGPRAEVAAKELFLHAAKDATLTVEWPKGPPRLDNPLWLLDRCPPSEPIHNLGATLWELLEMNLPDSFNMVLEPDRVRVLPCSDALTFWVQWWAVESVRK